MNKPPQTMTAMPTIPGHANSEWSSILPAILAGDSDNAETSPIETFDQESYAPDEKPMIQVPVITIEEPSQYEKPEDDNPVFQIVNTIPPEKANASINDQDQSAGASNSKPLASNDIPLESKTPDAIEKPDQKNDTLSIVSETHSTSVKISGQDEIKVHEETPVKQVQVVSTLDQKVEVETESFASAESTSTSVPSSSTTTTTTESVFEVATTENSGNLTKSSSPAKPAEDFTEMVTTEAETKPTNTFSDMPPTAATSISEELPQKTQSEALPTELTDSITSMISQVSDAIPSIMTMDEKSKIPEAEESGSGIIDAESSLESTSPVTIITTTKILANEEEIKESVTEKLEIITTTEIIKTEAPVSKTEVSELITQVSMSMTESPVSEIGDSGLKTEISVSKTEASIPEDEILTPKPELSIKIEATTTNQSNTFENPEVKTSSTSKPKTTISTLQDSPGTLPVNLLNKPTEVESKEDPVPESSTEKDLAITEKPIVRINITEIKEEIKLSPLNATNVTESNMVRIKLTDPVNKIHQTLESSPVQTSSPEIESLNLPTTEMAANGIGSGLIAGFNTEQPQISETSTESSTELTMQMIQFDQLPIVSVIQFENSTDKFIEASTVASTSLASMEPKVGITDASVLNRTHEIEIKDVVNKTTGAELVEKTPVDTQMETNQSTNATESKIHDLQIRKDQKKETSLEKPSVTNQITENTDVVNDSAEKWTLIPQPTSKLPEKIPEISKPSKTPEISKPAKTSEISKPTKTQEISKPSKISATSGSSPMQSNNIPVAGKIETPLPPRSPDPPSQHISLDHSKTTPGLDSSIQNLEPDVQYFSNLCNDLAFNFWSAVNEGLSKSRSLAVSPFGMTSMLAMIFLGARGPTSNQMNDVLKLDDITTFNPHLIFQNVTDSVASRRINGLGGVANAVFVRELFADKMKVNKLMTFYKEQAQKFYDGIVAEVNFSFVSNAVRRRTNLLVRKQTGGRIREFVKDNNLLPLRSPLAAVSANVFQTDCSSSNATSEGRDGELYFAVAPTIKLRKLVPVPATLWKAGVLAGYETSLDATAIALGGLDKMVSVIFVIPGSTGGSASGDNLDKLEARIVNGALHDGAWNKLLKVIIPRPGLELQVPKFSHKSIINATAALKTMGIEEIFEKHANLRGINDVGKDLHLADVFQVTIYFFEELKILFT